MWLSALARNGVSQIEHPCAQSQRSHSIRPSDCGLIGTRWHLYVLINLSQIKCVSDVDSGSEEQPSRDHLYVSACHWGGRGSMFAHRAKMIIDDSSKDEPLMAPSDVPNAPIPTPRSQAFMHAEWNVFLCGGRPLSHSKAKVSGKSSAADTAAKRSHILPPVPHVCPGTVA